MAILDAVLATRKSPHHLISSTARRGGFTVVRMGRLEVDRPEFAMPWRALDRDHLGQEP